MPDIKTYHLPPTPLIPNSPLPLLHYRAHFPTPQDRAPLALHALFSRNNWQTQWIWRYGRDQKAHYHSSAHECMVVLTGTAKIRFGVADVEGGTGKEEGGVVVDAREGDVFILPAGTAHKTFETEPRAELELLTPGDGHAVGEEGLRGVVLEGFTMMGAYPVGSVWDFATGGEFEGRYEGVWGVERPGLDPVLGGEGGVREFW